MTTEEKTDSYIRILKHPSGGFLADYHLPSSYGQLYRRWYRGLIGNVRGSLKTYLKKYPSSIAEIKIKSGPTPEEEFYNRYRSLSEKKLARMRKALSKKIPEITFS